VARPGTDPAATNAATTLRGLRLVALAVALALLALVLDARSRPAPPEPGVLLPVPPPSRPSLPRHVQPPVPAAEPVASEGDASPASGPGSDGPEPAPAAERGAAPAETPPSAAPAPSPLPEVAAEAAPTSPPSAGSDPREPTATGSAPPARSAPAPGGAPSVRDGVLAYQAGDYERALAIWRPLAEAGNARARFHLGALLLEGRVGPSDPAAAYRWLALAVEAGQTAAVPLRDQAAARLPPETVAALRRELGLPP